MYRLTRKQRCVLRLLIASQPRFGLDMVRASDGVLGRGTIYNTLALMEDKGYIRSEEVPRVAGTKAPPRRCYRITSLGVHLATRGGD